MINFLLGILLCLCIAESLVILYLVKKPTKALKEKLSTDEKRKEQEIRDHYDKISNYNANTAYGGN